MCLQSFIFVCASLQVLKGKEVVIDNTAQGLGHSRHGSAEIHSHSKFCIHALYCLASLSSEVVLKQNAQGHMETLKYTCLASFTFM